MIALLGAAIAKDAYVDCTADNGDCTAAGADFDCLGRSIISIANVGDAGYQTRLAEDSTLTLENKSVYIYKCYPSADATALVAATGTADADGVTARYKIIEYTAPVEESTETGESNTTDATNATDATDTTDSTDSTTPTSTSSSGSCRSSALMAVVGVASAAASLTLF